MIQRKNGNGGCGGRQLSQNCNNNFLHRCMGEIGGFMNVMSRDEPKDDVCLLEE